jgi:short-subunit dehydrogenase
VDKLFDLLDEEPSRRTGSNRFDILINNVGIASGTPIDTTSEQRLNQELVVNVKAPVVVTQRPVRDVRSPCVMFALRGGDGRSGL